MIKESKWPQYGQEGLTPRGIIVHNSDIYTTSEDLFKYYESEYMGPYCTHLIFDSTGMTEIMPLTWKVRSVQDSSAYKTCISICICLNQNEEVYKKGEDFAVEYIRELLREYHFSYDDIYCHNSFDKQTLCPSHILNEYGSFNNFIQNRIKEV